MIYLISYFAKLTELFKQEVETVYEIFEKDAVCQVIVTLLDRVFNDQTFGVRNRRSGHVGAISSGDGDERSHVDERGPI